MKKGLITTIVLSLLVLTGCSSSSNKNALERIKDNGEIVVAMEGTWAPWTYHNEQDELVGFDVDVAKAIGKKLGVKVKFKEGKWDGLLAGIDSGQYDMLVNGVEYTKERAEKYDFTEPYGYMHTVLITKSDNNSIKSFKDLNGKKTANSVGSTYQTLAEEYGAKVDSVDTIDETMELVLQGRVDATLNADVSYQDYISKKPDSASQLKIVDTTKDSSKLVIPLKKGKETDSLRKEIDQAIKELKEDGTISKLSMKYFGIDVSKE